VTTRIGPIVVGVDGSANARRAMVMAGRYARTSGTSVIVVHALGLTERLGDERVPAFGHRDEVATALDGWCDGLREDGCDDFESRLVDGSPVDAVLRVAEQESASAIVVGRRGAGGRPELRLGSTAHQIVEHARCPVIVIPPIGRSASVEAEPADEPG
jgi:nucleotide-binding universal stress UspA family protein